MLGSRVMQRSLQGSRHQGLFPNTVSAVNTLSTLLGGICTSGSWEPFHSFSAMSLCTSMPIWAVTQCKNLHLPFPSVCRSFSCKQAGLFNYYMWQDDWKPRRPTFSRSAPVLQGVPIGIHMQIALEMTDGDEGGEGGIAVDTARSHISMRIKTE